MTANPRIGRDPAAESVTTARGSEVAGEGAPDLRLAMPALAIWAGAFVALTVPVRAAVAAAAGALIAAAVLMRRAKAAGRHETAAPLLAGERPHGGPSIRPAGSSRAATGAAVLVCLAAGGLVATGRVAAAGLGPLPDLAAQRATATVQLMISDDPRELPPKVSGPRRGPAIVLVRARAEHVVARGKRTRVRTPVLVLSTHQGWLRIVPGERVQASGRLAAPRAGDSVAAVLQGAAAPKPVRAPPALQRTADRLRDGLRGSVSGLSPEPRGLVPGLVVGDTSWMPAELVDDFRAAGLSHLVAVSGANVAIIFGAVLLACRWIGVRRRSSLFIGALAMAGFVVLARPDPSVLRATAMGLVAVAALASGRPRRGLSTLCAVVGLLVLIDPWLARSYGFVLSVLATAGLLILAPPWRAAFARRLPGPVADALAVPMAAQVACAPVVAMLSAEVSLVAVPANLLAAPAVPPATVLGVLAAVTAPLASPLARVLGELAGVPATWIVAVAERSAAVPGAAMPWLGGAAGGLALALLAVVVWIAWPLRRRMGWLPYALVPLLVVVVIRPVLPPWWSGWPPPNWLVVACDVGQGDALALAAGPATAVVVDAGPDPKAVDRCLRRLGVRHVPYLLLSHFHADHVEGVPGVLRGRHVREIGVSPLADPPHEAQRVRRWAAARGIPLTQPTAGEVRQAGPWRWRVLWPRRIIRGDGSDANNASIAVLAERDGVSVLLTGDIEPAAQRAILAAEPGLRPTVLKVPHHGSAHQDPRLLRLPGVGVALISVGEANDYGHPGARTIDAMTAAGTRIMRTDEHGDIAVLGAANRVGVTWRGRRPSFVKNPVTR